MIASAAMAEVEEFPARPDQVGAARRFVTGHLSEHPCRGDAELLASELVTNAVSHGRTGEGDTVTVTLVATDQVVRMSVADHGRQPPCVCRLGAADDLLGQEVTEHGRGLVLVDRLALDCGGGWGFHRRGRGSIVWVELRADGNGDHAS